MDLFYFDTAGVRKLDAYQHIVTDNSLTVYGLSSPGPLYLAAFSARGNEGTRWWNIATYADLCKYTLHLKEDSPKAPFLSGEVLLDGGLSRDVTLPLTPMLSAIRLRSIRCDFSGRPYEGLPFANNTLFLSYAGVECHPLGSRASPPVSWLNAAGPDSLEIRKLPYPEMLLQEGCGAIGTEKRSPQRVFYCYPGPQTCLVLGGTIGEDTCYYPLPLQGLKPGQSVELDVVLRRKGSPEPDIPTESGAVEVASSLIPWEWEQEQTVTFVLDTGDEPLTRAALPEENRLSDYNLLIFNAFGDLEEQVYVPERDFTTEDGKVVYKTRLLKDVPYTVLAAANLGYSLPAMHLEAARQYRFYLSYPDEYSHGLPMAAVAEDCRPGEKMALKLERLMARIDLCVDRRNMEADMELKIVEVQVGCCPSSATLFPGSRVESSADLFANGFRHRGSEVDPLNRESGDGRSEVLPLYLLENLREEGGLRSYIEVKAEWHTSRFDTEPGQTLSYRFYPGSVARNTVYPFTLAFAGSSEERLSNGEFRCPEPP